MSNSKYAREPLELHQEIEELSSQLKEVIRMNTHWQRYDAQREDYVKTLTRTNQDLQDQVSKLQLQLKELQTDVGLREQPLGLQNDRTSSSESGSHWNAEDIIRTLKDHITKLNIQIHKMENESEKQQKQNEEHISLLREQVNICVDDFKQERRDRERCHEENTRLQKRLAQAENDLRLRKEQFHVNQTQIKEEQCYRYRQDHERTFDEPLCYVGLQERPRQQYRTQPLPRRHHTSRYHYRDYDFTDLPSDVEIDGCSLSQGYDEVDGPNPHDKITTDEVDGPSDCDKVASNRPVKHDVTDSLDQYGSYDKISNEEGKGGKQSPSNKGQTSDEDQGNKSLICPKCQKRFGVMKHLELLDHINMCVENE